MSIPSSPNSLLSKEELLLRLEEAEETLRAIQSGEVDALVVSGEQGEQVFTLKDATLPYQTLIEEMNESALTLSATGMILYCNARFAEILGLPMETILGEPLLRFLIPGDQASLQRLLEQRPEGRVRGELTLLGSQGEVPVGISMKELMLGGELRLGVVVTDLTEQKRIDAELLRYQQHLEELVQERTHDLQAANESLQQEITGRKLIEDALRESEQRYSTIFNESPIAMSLTKMPESIFVGVNNAFLKLFEFTREEVIGKTTLDLRIADSDTRAQVAAEMRAHGSLQNFEVTRITKTGRKCTLSLNMSMVSLDGGEHVLTTIRDITERKQAEEMLSRNQALLQTVLDNTPEAIYLKDRDGHLLLANPATLAIIGKPAEAVLGKTDVEFYDDPSTGRAIMENDRRIINLGQTEVFEERVVDLAGTRVYLSTKAPYRDADGQIIGLIGTARDITERKQMEEALRRSETLLLETGRMAKVGAWEFEIQTMRPSWTLETYRIHEVDPAFQPDFEHAIDFYAPQARPLIAEAVRRAMEEGQSYDLELPLITAKGRNIWVRTIGQPELRDGRCVRLFGTFQDITESRHAQEHLTFQANILANITDVVYATDEQLKLTFWNRAAERMYGWREEEVLGKSVVEVVNSRFDPEKRVRLSQELMESGSVTAEIEHSTRSGRAIFFESTTILLHDSTGKVSGFVSVNHDITERKQAESIQRQLAETLTQRVTELQTLMDVAPVGIAIGHDPQGQVITVNQILSDWLNAPQGVNVSLSIPEEEQQVGYQVLRDGRPARVEELPIQYAALNAKGVRNDEFSIVRSDGRTIEMLANAEPLFDDQGHVRGSVATYIDITEQKRARESLEQSSQKLNEILTSIQDDFYVLDRDWNFVYASRLFTSKVGKTPEDFIGNNIWEMFPKHMGTALEENFRAAMEKREVRRFEIGGKYTAAWYRMTVFPSADGITVLGTDITERKRAEEHVAYQARLLASVNDAILGSDAQFRVTAWNSSAEIMYGWKAEEVLGRDGLEILRTEWPQADAEVMRRTIAETGSWRGEATQLRKDGTRIPVEVSSMVLHDENGQITGYVSVNHDITERKQSEKTLKERTFELEESNRELARSNEDLEQFAYVASHDLQEPLRIMANFSQLLERRYKGRLDQDAEEFIAFIVDAAARMQKLITDLLAYSRAGHNNTDMAEVDCNKVIRRLVDGLAATIKSADGQVTFDQLPVITAHESSMTQLFQNLIGNALKFRSEQPPCIHVSARQGDGEWVFSVADNGIGLEPQYNQRIFMIFQRLHARDKYPGTGIGLSICKKIVENLGGRIWVDSEPGKGSTFAFTVPIKKNGG